MCVPFQTNTSSSYPGNQPESTFSPSSSRQVIESSSMNMAASTRKLPGTRRRSAQATQERKYVDHSYVDHYYDPIFRPEQIGNEQGSRRGGARGGVMDPFPARLYLMLSEADQGGFEHIVSWQPHGRCFIVHKPKQFVEDVMPK